MIRKHVVESVFKHNGLTCAALLMDAGHRCGYVGIPEMHPLYGRTYDDVKYILSVHGGITFNSDKRNFGTYPIATQEELWWFGFDCAHAGDARDYDAVVRSMPEHEVEIEHLKAFGLEIHGDTIKTTEYVEQECRGLADQLGDMSDELDVLEYYLRNWSYTFTRCPLFIDMPYGPEQISVYENGSRAWNVICAGGALEYSGPLFEACDLTAVKLIKELEKI
ncbi:MAG: hypothetical protein LUD72_11245 [Bacteroidales bacterium]|nr:hypothetical protein [Bacteroidales bacterium]